MVEHAGKSTNQVGSISTPATNDKATRYAKPAASHSTIFAFIGNFTEKDRSTK
jgi:hypothetical protein